MRLIMGFVIFAIIALLILGDIILNDRPPRK